MLVVVGIIGGILAGLLMLRGRGGHEAGLAAAEGAAGTEVPSGPPARVHGRVLLEPDLAPDAGEAERLLTRAETLAGLDHHDEAIVVALSAVDIADVPGRDPELQQVRELVRGPATHDELRDAAERVIARVRALVQSPD